ncbi:MAG: radical SAM protein [Anaerolineaceae bacterium]
MTNASVHTDESTKEMNLLMRSLIQMGPKITRNKPIIKMAMSMGENYFINDNKRRHKEDTATAPGVIDDQTDLSLSILHSVQQALSNGNLSEATFEKAATVLGKDLLVEKELRNRKATEFREKYGFSQPSFLLISPTHACNLRCIGCYADSDERVQKLEYDVFDKAVSEAYQYWGIQFIVISGGEPLSYHSQGKTLLDIAEAHPNMYFMFYTNSTLITPEIAKRMAKLGNIVPMISLEGWREKTDGRRGKGVFDKVMAAMDLLFEEGVLYGVSLTATRENAEEIVSEDFIDYLFDEKHALIAWVFHYMPIGRSFTLDLMPTPEQRIMMWNRSWTMVREKHRFIADFWNSGTAVNGCLSAGGHGAGGYMYIDWYGHVTPCVFLPYSPVNINDVYAKGGTLEDIYQAPFFDNLRQWQVEIANKTGGSNLMNPCPIRDHNADLRQMIAKHEPDPIDINAEIAMQDPAYAAGMDAYDAKYQKIVDTVWQKAYIENKHLSQDELDEIVSAIDENQPIPVEE